MLKRALCAFLVIFVFFGAGNLFAQALPDGGIKIEEMVKILTDKGYKASVNIAKNANEETYIDSAAEGLQFSIYFYDIASDGRATNIQYCVSFEPADYITNDEVIEWNKRFRFARMYLSNANYSYWEMDRDVEHGCTVEAIKNDLERWFSMLNSINKFVNDKSDEIVL